MKFNAALLGALATLVSAHSDYAGEPVPQMIGGKRFLAELRSQNPQIDAQIRSSITQKRDVESQAGAKLEKRDDLCGPGVGSCPTGQCCSPAGFCGTTEEYCAAPDCQLAYGSACDGNKKPSGASTASFARPQLGDVLLGGAGIYDCVNNGDVAFTFDDGPYTYTSDLLDKLDAYGAKATFFITGNNLGKGPIDTTATWSNIIKRMASSGHQVASHTWSHQNLTSLDPVTFKNQMVYNEMAFRNILGYWPSYMRPPYSECNSTCGSLLAKLGYVVTYFDLDTAGYLNDGPKLIQNSKNIWDKAMKTAKNTTSSFLEIEHDIHYQTVYNLTDYILASGSKKGFKFVTVGECLGDPIANWYRYGNETGVQAPSTDGTCGGSVTCLGSSFGNCCSLNGYCGSDVAHCGNGCQAAAGNCTIPAGQIDVSFDGSCGPHITCVGSQWGNCCSGAGYCGNTTDYCGTGCQSAYGNCPSTSTLLSTSASTATSLLSSVVSTSTSAVISTSSSTIGSLTSSSTSSSSTSPSTKASTSSTSSSTSTGTTTTTSAIPLTSSSSSSAISTKTSTLTTSGKPATSTTTIFSSPSSSSTPISVTKASVTSAPPTPTPTPKLVTSRDGSCGGKTGYTCQGFLLGGCCSALGRCGPDLSFIPFLKNSYCGTGCQPAFGKCV
ncbi:hypothetical protein BP5796_08470 [Coleophoma crateriformis]|uniref:Carbohydrate esterase family 4 protein n=1 Tax=Coleophoma crateriformis TaxID=565419 RepID=A0A3D8R7Q0_9HELO|nr:hypothetical protein BP5796_08470 [Coleophoma crateriformis]